MHQPLHPAMVFSTLSKELNLKGNLANEVQIKPISISEGGKSVPRSKITRRIS